MFDQFVMGIRRPEAGVVTCHNHLDLKKTRISAKSWNRPFWPQKVSVRGEKGYFTAQVPVRKEETVIQKEESRGRLTPYCRLSHVPSCGSCWAKSGRAGVGSRGAGGRGAGGLAAAAWRCRWTLCGRAAGRWKAAWRCRSSCQRSRACPSTFGRRVPPWPQPAGV